MMRRVLAFILLALGLTTAAGAQGRDQYRLFVEKYDLDATTLTYCVTDDVAVRGVEPAVTSGSSTTVTSASGTPFDIVSVGDILYFGLSSGLATRYVTAKASGSSITVDTAIDLGTTGTFFTRRKVACGTASTSGWMTVADYGFKAITFQLDQINATGGIDVRWECKAQGEQAAAVKVYPGNSSDCGGGTLAGGFCNFTTAGITSRFTVVIEEPWYQCRVGMAIHTSDDGDDTGANAEQISIYFVGTKLTRP